MQFLTLSRRPAKQLLELDFHRRLEAEAHLVGDLQSAGIIREVWHRGDLPGTCFLVEAGSEHEARATLESSRLIRSGFLEIVDLVPLRPYCTD